MPDVEDYDGIDTATEYTITSDVEEIVEIAGIKSGLVNVYVQGATAGIMIQKN